MKDLKNAGKTLILLDLEKRLQMKFDIIESKMEFRARENFIVELITKDANRF